jgi:lysozyme
MLTDEGYAIIKQFEGYLRRLNDGTDRVAPYLCPAHVPTIGWGSTRYFSYDGAVATVQGRVKMSDPPIDRARAEECFRGELAQNEQDVDRLIITKMHPLMRDAIVSFTYNVGSGALRASTLRRVINSQEWDKVPAQLAKWRMGGGRILNGLVRRRRVEAELFMEGVRRLQSGDVGEPIATPPPAQAAPPPAPVAPAPVAKAPANWWRSVVDWVLK